MPQRHDPHDGHSQRTNLLGLTRAELEAFVVEMGEKPFRARQLFKWIYQRAVGDFDAMTDLARTSASAWPRSPKFARPKSSCRRSPPTARASGCCSSKAARPSRWCSSRSPAAARCASRARSAARWTARSARRRSRASTATSTRPRSSARSGSPTASSATQPDGDRVITNVVFMGMGEPLANYRNVVPAAEIMMDDLGLDLSRRRVTVSTSGLVPQMLRIAEETNVALAVSLHAPNDELRSELVPINRKHPIAELLDACWHYVEKQNARNVTFEYVMLDGVNDQPRARARAGAAAARAAREGQPDPVQPVSGHAVPPLERDGDRAVPRHPAEGRRDRDDAAHARRRHRCGLRPAGRSRQRPRDRTAGPEDLPGCGGAGMKRRDSHAALVAAAAVAALARAARAFADDPNSRESKTQAAEINTQLALAYMREGNLQAAREKIDKALQQNPHTADTQMAAGFIYDRLGETKKASTHYEQAARLGEGNPDVLQNAAVYLCRTGDYKRGEKYLLQAATSPLYRTPAVAYTNAGRCAARRQAPEGRRDSIFARRWRSTRSSRMRCCRWPSSRRKPAAACRRARSSSATPRLRRPVARRSGWAAASSSASATRTQAARYAQRLKMNFRIRPETGAAVEAEQARHNDSARCRDHRAARRARAHASGVNAKRAADRAAGGRDR